MTLQVAGAGGVTGSRVTILDKNGKSQGTRFLGGGEGRGGHPAPQAHYALSPGTYRMEVRYSSGIKRAKEIVVAGTHVRAIIDDQTPRAD